MGFFSSKPPPTKAQAKAATKVTKCSGCKKSKLACSCTTNPRKPIKEKVKVTNSRGHQQTVTRNSKTVTADTRGNVWCAQCSCRVMAGQCSNVRCSTRR